MFAKQSLKRLAFYKKNSYNISYFDKDNKFVEKVACKGKKKQKNYNQPEELLRLNLINYLF